jgi:hypothetical protein
MKMALASLLFLFLVQQSANAQIARGGGSRIAVQNRSVNSNVNVNRNANVNRNVNVNQNVNVNRNVNVNTRGTYYGGRYYGGPVVVEDHSWNWGSFAAGAAAGVATTAAVAAATKPSTTTVMTNAPAVGTIITTLPSGCTSMATGGVAIYSCSNVYYKPFYQGTTLVYQVVTHP